MVKHLKKLVDPNAPKRPALPFIRWRSDNTKRIINSLKTGFTRQDLGAKFSEEWAACTEADKKPYEEAYNTQMEKYKRLSKAYKLTAKFAVYQKKAKEHNITKEKATKFPKDENAPKRPLSGYFLFLGDQREAIKADNPDITHKEVVAKMGEMWTAMNDDRKGEWNAKAAKGKAKYEKKLAAYKKTAQYADYQKRKEEFNSDKKLKVKKLTAKLEPKKEKKVKKAVKVAKPAKKVKSAKKAKTSKKKATKKRSNKPKAPKRAASAKKIRAPRKAGKRTGKKAARAGKQ